MEPRNSAFRERDLAVSVIRLNPNFRFSNMGKKIDNKVNFCVDSWRAVDRIRERRPLKVSRSLISWERRISIRLQFANACYWKAAYRYTVDDQIRPILLRSATAIYIPIHMVGIGKMPYQWNTYRLVYPIYITS